MTGTVPASSGNQRNVFVENSISIFPKPDLVGFIQASQRFVGKRRSCACGCQSRHSGNSESAHPFRSFGCRGVCLHTGKRDDCRGSYKPCPGMRWSARLTDPEISSCPWQNRSERSWLSLKYAASLGGVFLADHVGHEILIAKISPIRARRLCTSSSSMLITMTHRHGKFAEQYQPRRYIMHSHFVVPGDIFCSCRRLCPATRGFPASSRCRYKSSPRCPCCKVGRYRCT